MKAKIDNQTHSASTECVVSVINLEDRYVVLETGESLPIVKIHDEEWDELDVEDDLDMDNAWYATAGNDTFGYVVVMIGDQSQLEESYTH